MFDGDQVEAGIERARAPCRRYVRTFRLAEMLRMLAARLAGFGAANVWRQMHRLDVEAAEDSAGVDQE